MEKEQLKQKLIELDLVVDNEYLDKYCELVLNNLDSPKVKFKTQGHHVIPVYYYQMEYHVKYTQALKFADEDLNNIKINLTHEKHFWAHYYLCLCSPLKYANANGKAISKMLNCRFDELKRNELKQRATKLNEIFKEVRIEMSQKMSNTMWVKKGEEEKIIDKSEKEKYIKEGWEEGRQSLKEETKKILSELNSGENNHFYNKKHTLETRKLLKKLAIERFKNPEEIERLRQINIEWCSHPENIERKRREALKQPNVLPIYCISTKTIYTCLKDAERKTGVIHKSIAECCKGIRVSAGGMYWCYLKDKDTYVIRKPKKCTRKIECDNDHKQFESIKLASEYYHISATGIGDSCRKGTTCKGLKFKYIN